MIPHTFLYALLLLLLPVAGFAQNASPTSNEEADWQAVLALEAGPQNAEAHTREQVRTITLAHLARQETALRGFLKKYPQSPRAVDARLRLARLLATRSDLNGKVADFDASLRLLDETLPTAPEERRPDIEFARIALVMHRVAIPTDRDREALEAQMAAFQGRYPNDRRVAPLMAEVATLFDNQPRRKEALLKEALAAARSPEVRARIEDDLRRLSFLGCPIDVRGATADGAEVNLARCRGKVTLVYFFASWSAPSLAGIEEVEYLRKTFASEPVEVIGVSLDPTREALDATVKARGLPWPVIFDGKGWKSPLVRGLSLNAIPTLWIVDRKGCLRTLNARTESESLVRELLREKQ